MEKEKSKIWLSKDGIVNIKMVKDFDGEAMDTLVREGKELARNLTKKAPILVDLSIGLIALSSQFRKDLAGQIKELTEDPGFTKLAIFGGGVAARTVASFVITASGIKTIKIFENKEQALKWLKES